MKIQLVHKFEDIINIENLLEAWKEFLKGKKQRKDVQEFSMRLMDNIFSLHNDLINHTYKHGGYQAFKINDPKPRNIHKAGVRDRLLHHAIYRILYPFFDKTFIVDSYSCRLKKGTHKAVNRFREFVWKVSKNNTKTCWVLKCDIRKFFANINQDTLISILREYIPDEDIIELLEKVIGSFNSPLTHFPSHPLLISPSGRGRGVRNIGLPLGNLTSQLFVNIYMNRFDQFVKHKLKVKYYIRYADDFVILAENRKWPEEQIVLMREFLYCELKLELHPDKIFIKTLASGMDFLGLINFPEHRILRTKTRKRMFKKIENKYNDWQGGLMLKDSLEQSLQSYFGMLKHCNGYGIVREIKEKYFYENC
ncbi:MAG: reverse transcriptase/maturase family protein [Candidatus Portnoybacteria bacterium]|nr:reverse transcriptase/maturase family protein [Candidatus Portnoybacteria bacterium]